MPNRQKQLNRSPGNTIIKDRSPPLAPRGRTEKYETPNEPSHEIMVLFVLRKFILQTGMRSHPAGLDVWFLLRLFVYFHTLCVRTAKVLARLCGCAVSPEPSLVAHVVSTIISWAGSNVDTLEGTNATTKFHFPKWDDKNATMNRTKMLILAPDDDLFCKQFIFDLEGGKYFLKSSWHLCCRNICRCF